MCTRSSRLMLLVFGCLCLVGCVTNISHDARFRTDYVVGGTYRVKKELFCDRGKQSIFGAWDYRILRLPESRFAGIPSTVAQYEHERATDWKNIAGVVRVGTSIKVKKIKLERNPEMGRSIWVEGEILDGDLEGMKDVELSLISRKIHSQEQFVYVPMVDGEILERLPQ